MMRFYTKSMPLLTVTGLPYPHIASGKVRELFDVGENLLLIATDRLSAYDVVLPDGIPDKGGVLTQISLHWFGVTGGILPNHLVPNHEAALASVLQGREELISRSMLVRKLKPLPVEAVVRGALAGSGWKVYRQTGNLFGQAVPAGLLESSLLPEPLFTPTTKAQAGHDEPLTLQQCEALLGTDLFRQVKDASLRLFALGAQTAARAGLILADTKFEFGLDSAGKLHLIDEVMTPDSSRYWPAAGYAPGKPQPSYDKQFVRDYLETLDWPKTPPGPRLPAEVIEGTRSRYLEALEKLTGSAMNN